MTVMQEGLLVGGVLLSYQTVKVNNNLTHAIIMQSVIQQ